MSAAEIFSQQLPVMSNDNCIENGQGKHKENQGNIIQTAGGPSVAVMMQ